MNLYQCEAYAKKNGFDTVKFIAKFPVGDKKCEWLDAYFGFFQVEGMKGFATTSQIDEMFPDLVCEVIEDHD